MISTATKPTDVTNNLLVTWYNSCAQTKIEHYPLSRRIMYQIRNSRRRSPIVQAPEPANYSSDTVIDPLLSATARVAEFAAEFVLSDDDDI